MSPDSCHFVRQGLKFLNLRHAADKLIGLCDTFRLEVPPHEIEKQQESEIPQNEIGKASHRNFSDGISIAMAHQNVELHKKRLIRPDMPPAEKLPT